MFRFLKDKNYRGAHCAPVKLSVIILLLITVIQFQVQAINFIPSFLEKTPLNSQSAIMVNLTTGETVFEQETDIHHQPAMLTHILLAAMVLEECPDIDNTTITADYNLYTEWHGYIPQSDIKYGNIGHGETLTVKDYLHALLLASSVEAANVLANYFGQGSMQGFIVRMNQKAVSLGAVNTSFVNVTGLLDPNQLTTASDMAKIAIYALSNPKFTQIATADDYVTADEKHHWYSPFDNSVFYEGIRAIKSGSLGDYGRNLITICDINSGSRSNRYLFVSLCSPLGNTAHIDDANKIFKWANEHLIYKNIVNTADPLGETKVLYAEKDKNYVLAVPEKSFSILWDDETDTNAIERRVTLEKKLIAPIEKGQLLGTVELRLQGRTLESINLIAYSDIPRSNSEFTQKAIFSFGSSEYFRRAIIISCVFAGAYILLCIFSLINSDKKKNRHRMYRRKIKRRR